MPFQVHLSSTLWGDDFKSRSTTQPTKAESTHQHAANKTKKELQAFLGIINYLGKFSPRTAEVWVAKKTYITQSRIDVEHHIP